MAGQTQVVGIYPHEALESRARLLDGLARFTGVSFVGAESDAALAGAISFAGADAISHLADTGTPCFAAPTNGAPAQNLAIELAQDEHLDPRLRGRTLAPESSIEFQPLSPTADDRVLASTRDGAFWLQRGGHGPRFDVVAAPVPELDGDEVLRDCLSPGRCMALLPLVHFLRQVTRDTNWQPPPLRATLMIDDPNLHGLSYGYVNFPSLVAHAEEHNYHLSSATIPLDSWYVHAKTARYFREHADRISLLFHGNNHSRHELAEVQSEPECLALAAQAIRRIETLEARSGLHVARVMAAPHGKCAPPMAAAMARVGFDAMCHSRPFPWIKRYPPDVPLSGMLPAQWTDEGLPVLPRFSMRAEETDILLRAFVDQPLILLGHHWDAVNNYEVFERAARIVNSLGPVQWMDVETMAHSNYATRRDGTTLHVRAYSKQLNIAVPEGVEAIEVEVPIAGDAEGAFVIGGEASQSVRRNGALHGPLTNVSGGRCNVRWRHAHAVDPAGIAAPGTPLQHVVRRMATELRDRVRPLTGR